MANTKTDEFLQKLKDAGKWNNDYDYSKVEYVNNSTKIIIIDKKFNTEHLIIPNSIVCLNTKCCSRNLRFGYLPFEEAREFVRVLKLKNQKEWNDWSKNVRPHNIPVNPSEIYKNSGWVSMGDWLGTGKIADQFKIFPSYEKSKKYIASLHYSVKPKTQKEYVKYIKENKDCNLPVAAHGTYKKEWKGYGDFLGTGRIASNLRIYPSYEDAKKYFQDIPLEVRPKTQKEYLEFVRVNKNCNLPSVPSNVYKKDWKNNGYMGGFLGTGRVATKDKMFPSYEDSKKYIQSIPEKIRPTTMKEYKEYVNVNKSCNIPLAPAHVYKEVFNKNGGLKAFLGFNIKIFKTYKEAKKYLKNLSDGIRPTTTKEYRKYIKKNKDCNLPISPDYFYKKEWENYGDFLGTGKIADQNKIYLSIEDAKKVLKPIGLKSREEYIIWWKKNKPYNIPAAPNATYKNSGWVSMGDFLGYIGNGQHQWTKGYMLEFIKSLQPELLNLDSVELITIISANNIAGKLKELGSLDALVSSDSGTKERRNIIKDIINKIEKQKEPFEDVTVDESVFDKPFIEGEISGVIPNVETELEELKPTDFLHVYDKDLMTASLDDENIEFLMKNQLKKLWNEVLNKKINISEYKKEKGREKFTIIKNLFFEEYTEVLKIKPPDNYIFKYPLNLMQKLVTYRLIKELRYGNWSGTGAGKTLSAIFAGRYAGAKNTVIICNNATVEGYVKSINEYFTNNTVYTKQKIDYTDSKLYTVVDRYDIKFSGENNYLILNYETFQQKDGENVVFELLKNNKIDYIILDEVQNVKQREEDSETTRRSVINKLVVNASEKNENLLVMAMSATPFINNLTEPKKLIELLTSKTHNELDTKETILNGLGMYKALTRNGIRYKPDYGVSVNEEIIEVDGSHLSAEIIKIPKGAIVDFEKVLIQTKLAAISNKIKKGTLIYTHYVSELTEVIGEYVSKLGFSIGYCIGDDKSGLQPFKEGKIDVLIGSTPVGTGVDGIQYVCNTLIPIILPWTSSEYDQLVGRVNRQGSSFKHVNVYIPQVVIQLDKGIWSWDKRRHNIIKTKATIADLAVDGRVPASLLPPKSKLIEDAQKELIDWMERLNNGSIITFDRENLSIPLNPKQITFSRNKLGDFSTMNKEWSVSRSDNTHKRLSENPEEWFYYHTLYSESRKTWSEIPYIEIAKKIKSRPDWIVGDFGCGENLLSKEIKNKVYSFDHVAVDNNVIACDIKNVPIENDILDVAVLSLSLMGSNHIDYFKEAYRTLKVYGSIFVCEPAEKYEGREGFLKTELESVGFKCFNAVKNTEKFIYIDGVKY